MLNRKGEISRETQAGGQKLAVMVGWWQKNTLIVTVQVNCCCFIPVSLGIGNNSPELLLLKFLPAAYYHSQFLVASLDFTCFHAVYFTLVAAPFFTAWLFFEFSSFYFNG